MRFLLLKNTILFICLFVSFFSCLWKCMFADFSKRLFNHMSKTIQWAKHTHIVLGFLAFEYRFASKTIMEMGILCESIQKITFYVHHVSYWIYNIHMLYQIFMCCVCMFDVYKNPNYTKIKWCEPDFYFRFSKSNSIHFYSITASSPNWHRVHFKAVKLMLLQYCLYKWIQYHHFTTLLEFILQNASYFWLVLPFKLVRFRRLRFTYKSISPYRHRSTLDRNEFLKCSLRLAWAESL